MVHKKIFHAKIARSQHQMHTVYTAKNICTNAQPTVISPGYWEKRSEWNDVSSKLEMKSVSAATPFRNRTWPSLPFREDFLVHENVIWSLTTALIFCYLPGFLLPCFVLIWFENTGLYLLFLFLQIQSQLPRDLGMTQLTLEQWLKILTENMVSICIACSFVISPVVGFVCMFKTHTHVKDQVDRVWVWWITETQKDPACTLMTYG